MTIAEESTSWPKVSPPVYEGGLGFGFKWNMGFMNDTAASISPVEPIHRQHHHNEMTFGLLYAFTREFRAAASHDEVVHGKGTLLSKMAGDDWQKFANAARLLRLHVGLSGQEAAVHGPGVRAAQRMERGEALDWYLLDCAPAPRRAAGWSATSTISTARGRRCTRATASRKASAG